MKFIDNFRESLKKIRKKKIEKGSADKKNNSNLSLQQYLIIGLGVLVMIGGAGFVLWQVTGNTGDTGLKPVNENNAGNNTSGENHPSIRNLGNLLNDDNSEVVNPLSGENIGETPKPHTSPEPETKKSKISVSDSRFPASTNASRSPNNKKTILIKLASMKNSITDSLNSLSSSIARIEDGIDSNREKINNLAANLNTDGGVNQQKYADLQVENRVLENKISNMKNRVRKAESDYKWLRDEYMRKKKALKRIRKEKKNLEKRRLSTSSLFPGWEMAGLAGGQLILMKKHGDRIRYLKIGESFMGVKLIRIDIENEKVYTDAGTRQL